MKSRILKYSAIILSISTITIFLSNCVGTGDPYEDPEDTLIVELDKVSGSPGAILSIETNFDLYSDSYTGYLDGNELTLSKSGQFLSFMVPSITSGTYTLSVDIEGESYSFDIEVLEEIQIADVDLYIQEVFDSSASKSRAYEKNYNAMISAGVVDSSTAMNDKVIWDDIKKQAEAEYASMTADQKLKLAQVLEANKDWIDEIDALAFGESFLYRSGKEECKKIIEEGKQELEEGNTFTALGYSVRASWCAVTYYTSSKFDKHLGKAAEMWDNVSLRDMRITLINQVGEKIENLKNELYSSFSSDDFIAEDIEDAEERKAIEFNNGDPKVIYAKIRFRSLRSSDASGSGLLSDAANFYNNFIVAYNDYVKSVNEALIWRPEFRNTNKVVKFNQFLDVPKSSVTNDKVILLNTQTRDDNWEIVFATDEDEDQSFQFDIFYDDGNVKLSKTFSANVILEKEFAQVTDIDGNTYKTVKIGTQTWMAENLKVTKYPDGSPIPHITSDSDWWTLGDNNSDDAYCYYNNNKNGEANIYGALYTWSAAMGDNAVSSSGNPSGVQGVCPAGWHMPSDSEWKELTDYLGGEKVAGGKLKETGTAHWNTPNTADNSTGFTALGAGLRSGYDGKFYFLGGGTIFWSSTERNSTQAWLRNIGRNAEIDKIYGSTKSDGFSVRCIKD